MNMMLNIEPRTLVLFFLRITMEARMDRTVGRDFAKLDFRLYGIEKNHSTIAFTSNSRDMWILECQYLDATIDDK